jgi:hypothetical protein
MTEKLAFELVETDDPDSYLIRMTNNGQVAELTHSEGFAKSFTIEPIRILYDEGNGEIVLAEGFEDRTPSGRIAMRVLDKVYSHALSRILARRGVRRLDDASKQALCVFF